MQFTDSVTRKFLDYSSPAWRTGYAAARPNKWKDYEDPTYIGFYVRFKELNQIPYGDLTGDFDQFPGGLLYNEEHPDSAIKYLKNMGEYTRAQMLREFIGGLQNIQNMPWFITKVSGMEEIWKINPGESFRGKEKKLSFETLESIDLKMTYLMDLYRKIVFDSVYMRWMLPQNLRTFDMELVITEIRSMQRPADVLPSTNDPAITQDVANFQNPIQAPPIGNINIPGLAAAGIQSAVSAVVPNTQWASGLSNALISTLQRDPGSYSSYPVLLRSFDELATFLVFEFSHCEFDIKEEAPPFLGSIGKIAEKEATNKFTIKTPIIRERNTYGLLGAILKDTQGLLDRNADKIPSFFWDPLTQSPPSTEIGYIQGVKGEVFDTSKQTLHQSQLKEENTRANGLLGGLLGTVSTVVTSQLSAAVQDTVAGLVLGNAFSDFFPPQVAQAISDKVQLEAPPFIQNLLSTIVLQSNGATSAGPVSPPTEELVAPPISEGGGTVVFIAPSTTPSAPGTVPFEEAPVGSATATNVSLDQPLISDNISGSVELQAPPLTGAPPSNIVLEAPLISPSPDKAVVLEGPILGPPTASSVTLTSPPVNGLTGNTVDLEGPAIANDPPGQADLVAPPTEGGRADSVDLEAPPKDNIAPPSNVELASAPASPVTVKVVQLDSPPVSPTQLSNVKLDDGGASMDGRPGSVSLDGPKIPKTLSANEVNLVEARPNTDTPANVELTEAPVSNVNVTNVDLQAPNVSNIAPDPVRLEEPPKSNVKPTTVNLQAPPSPEIAKEGNFGLTPDFGSVPLEGPSIPDKILGKEDLTGPAIIKQFLNPVVFNNLPKNDDDPGKVLFDSYRVNQIQDLGNADLEGQRIEKPSLGKVIMKSTGEKLDITNYTTIGQVDLNASRPESNMNEKNTGMKGPDVNLQSPGTLGNSPQEAPPTNTDK